MSEVTRNMIEEMAERWGDDVGYWKGEAERLFERSEATLKERDTAEAERDKLAEENKRLREALASLKFVSKHMACMYRPDSQPETSVVNDKGIDWTLHCCDWNEVYETCCVADGEENPRAKRIAEQDEIIRARAAIGE